MPSWSGPQQEVVRSNPVARRVREIHKQSPTWRRFFEKTTQGCNGLGNRRQFPIHAPMSLTLYKAIHSAVRVVGAHSS
jgi:hypothetical protein